MKQTTTNKWRTIIISIILLATTFISAVSANTVYTQPSSDASTNMNWVNNTEYWSFSFTANDTVTINNVTMYFSGVTGVANLSAHISNDNSGTPFSSFIADTATITVAPGNNTFVFVNTTPLITGNRYWLTLARTSNITDYPTITYLTTNMSESIKRSATSNIYDSSTLVVNNAARFIVMGDKPSNYTITAFDKYTGQPITNFSVSVNNTNYSTHTGSITTNINYSAIVNVTFLDANNTFGHYFNATYLLQDTSTNSVLNATLYQVEAKMNATEINTNALLTGQFVLPQQTTTSIFYLKAGSYNVTFVNASYNNQTQEFTFTALQNVSRTVENVTSTTINITAQNITGNTTINVFNGWVAYSDGTFNTTFSTTTGSYIANTQRNKNYTVYINASDHATITGTNYKTINTTNGKNNLTYYLYPDKSFEAYIKDLTTNNALSGALLTLYGATNTYNYTVNTKTFQFNLTTDNYNFVLTLPGYTTVTGTIPINPQSLYNTTIYMINNTVSTTTSVTVFVRNNQNQYLSNASIRIIRDYDGATVSHKYTDSSGGALFSLDNTLNYHINITLAGFQNFYDSFNVVDSTYTFTLTADTTTIPSLYSGINVSWTPNTYTQINNATNTSIGLSYNTTGYWVITNCIMTTYTEDSSTTTILATNTSGSCAATTGNIYTTFNTQNYTFVESIVTFTLNSTYNITYRERWGIGYYYEGEASIKRALEDFKAFNKAGFGDFERYLAVFVVILTIILSVASTTETFGVSTRTFMLMWALIGVASVANLLSLPFGVPFIKQWGIFVIITMFLIVTVAQKKELVD